LIFLISIGQDCPIDTAYCTLFWWVCQHPEAGQCPVFHSQIY